MRNRVASPKAAAPVGPYSPGVLAGSFLFLASQGPLDPVTGQIVGHDAASQARQVLANVEALCAEAGATLDDVVRIQLYLADLADLPAVNEVFRQVFAEPFPARSPLQVGLPGLVVAMEATVHVPPAPAAGEQGSAD